jgi:hypothetical protein
MNSSSKEIIFFLMFFLLTILSGISTEIIVSRNENYPFFLILIGFSFISTLILLTVYKTAKVTEGFHFEVTPEKTCDGGAYMHQSNEMCQKLWSTAEGRKDLATYNCLNGDCAKEGLYNGRPLNMGYRQDLSDDNWQNTSCQGNFLEKDRPMVL